MNDTQSEKAVAATPPTTNQTFSIYKRRQLASTYLQKTLFKNQAVEAGKIKYDFVNLPFMLSKVHIACEENSLAVVENFTDTKYSLKIVDTLDPSQQIEVCNDIIPCANFNDPKGKGSALTYQRRQMHMLAFNIFPDEDDDGDDANITYQTQNARENAKASFDNANHNSVTSGADGSPSEKYKEMLKEIDEIFSQKKDYPALKADTARYECLVEILKRDDKGEIIGKRNGKELRLMSLSGIKNYLEVL